MGMAKVVTIVLLILSVLSAMLASLPMLINDIHHVVFGVLNIMGNASTCGLTASQMLGGA